MKSLSTGVVPWLVTSLDGGPGDRRWLASGEQPAGRGGRQGDAHDHEDEIEHRDPTEIAKVVEVGRHDNEIGAGHAEERAEEGEPAGGDGGQRAADPARGSGRAQGAEIAGGLAADQPDGHGQDREREEGARGGRDGAELRLGGGLAPCLDRQAGGGRELAGIGDLLARQRPARLDEPAGRDLSPAAAAKTVECDERGRRRSVSLRRAEALPAVDRLDVGDGKFVRLWFLACQGFWRLADRDELVGRDGAVGEEVRARIDGGGVDSEGPEQGRRGDVEARFGDPAAPSWAQAQDAPP